jgi:hypothetical protein
LAWGSQAADSQTICSQRGWYYKNLGKIIFSAKFMLSCLPQNNLANKRGILSPCNSPIGRRWKIPSRSKVQREVCGAIGGTVAGLVVVDSGAVLGAVVLVVGVLALGVLAARALAAGSTKVECSGVTILAGAGFPLPFSPKASVGAWATPKQKITGRTNLFIIIPSLLLYNDDYLFCQYIFYYDKYFE